MNASRFLQLAQRHYDNNGPDAPVIAFDGNAYSGFVADFDAVPGSLVLDETGSADETTMALTDKLTAALDALDGPNPQGWNHL